MLTSAARRLFIYLITNARFRRKKVTTSAPWAALLLGLHTWIQWEDLPCLDVWIIPLLVAPFGLIKTISFLLNKCWSLQKAVKHHCSAPWPWTTSTGALLLWKTHVALSLLIHRECEWHMHVCLRGEHKLWRSQLCSCHLLKLQSCFWGQPRCRTTGT